MKYAIVRGWMSWVLLARVIGLALAVVGSGSCNRAVTQGRSPAFLIVDRLSGASGASPGVFSTVLQSDVLTRGGIFEDLGEIQVRLGFKDPGTPQIPTTPTYVNYITVTRYRVVFRRADGRNTPGVDVPYPFDGGLTMTVREIGQNTIGVFTLVRAQAKFEPPLSALRELGGAVAISTIAEVTLYGHDQTGVDVSVTGMISVNFADWGDPR